MVVTKLEEIGKSKIEVFLDYEYAFLLYQKDIDIFGLEEGKTLSDLDYQKIIEDTVFRRAKQKALAILKYMDRTEQELRAKLAEGGYTEDIINRTMAYISEYGYINDERYASYYIRTRMNTKSKLVIKNELYHKGIGKDVIDRIMQVEYASDDEEDAELNAIRKAVARKTNSPETLDPEKKQKLIASLYRKGFDIAKIKQIIK